jgi:hypothetical protein
MRIISDFHDYYDVVQAAGQDQSLIYFRKPEEEEVSNYSLPVIEWSVWASDRKRIQIQEHSIGFCGKVYPAILLTQVTSNKSALCYNLLEVDAFIESNYRKREVQEYRAKTKRPWRYSWQSNLRREVYESFFTQCAAKKDAFAEMFVEKQCPVWIGTVLERAWRRCTGKITYNGSLKELEFFRLCDTYTAFQEIAMFLGGLAVPLKQIPEVPDKIVVGIKGFDEWSFRKQPRER